MSHKIHVQYSTVTFRRRR